MSKLKRETKETRIVTGVRIGTGAAKVSTGDQFLTHMVETLARYGREDLLISGWLEGIVVLLGRSALSRRPERDSCDGAGQ